MRMLVLGAGLQGSACAFDLLRRPDVERVTLADLQPKRAAAFLKKKKDKRLVTVRLDAKRGPQLREPPLNYQIVYSLEGALDYYTTPSWVLRDGRPERVDALSEVEAVEFPSPVGTLEAFHTGGGISTMPWAYRGRVRTMEYKTLRYPGHVAIMRPIRELGLLSLDPVSVKGTEIVPREAFIATVSPQLTKPNARDLVALRVEVQGRGGRRVAWQLLDYYDEATGISAMMRTTGFSLAITGVMQVDGRIKSTGVYTPDEAVPFRAYVDELKQRGMEVRQVT